MAYFTAMLLCVSAFLILTVFELLTIVSQQDRRISTLAQSTAILMEKQKDLERRLERTEEASQGPSHGPSQPDEFLRM
jgi:hypothetical protein